MERDGYLLYSQTRGYQKRVSGLHVLVDSFFDRATSPYISMSFGKDSLAMAHLILINRPQVPLVYVNCGKYDEWPDTPRVIEQFLATHKGCEFIELQGPSIWEYYEEVGWYLQDEESEKAERGAQRRYSESLGDLLGAWAEQNGMDGSFIGMRKSESRIRSRLLITRGNTYFAKTRNQWVCAPMADWNGKDIWATIYSNDLPYNELYDLMPQGRELARNGAMFGTRSARYGRLAFLKRAYPELFYEFAGTYPEVRNYV